MFLQVFFLLIILLIGNFHPVLTPLCDFSRHSFGILLFPFFAFIALQSFMLRRFEKLSPVISIQTIMFWAVVYFFLSPCHLLRLPMVLSSNLILITYLTALFLSTFIQTHSLFKAFHHIRFLIAFVLPMWFFQFLILLSEIFFAPWMVGMGYTLTLVTLLGLFLLIWPLCMQKIWGCMELPPSPLRSRLEELCRMQNFDYRGLKIWPCIQDPTALILGPISPFRYILFTPALLERLSDEELEALLVHEMGHAKNYHLIFYPLIAAGFLVLITFVHQILHPILAEFVVLKKIISSHVFWLKSYPVLILASTVMFLWLYFRFVYGFFSRLFERQADLYIFEARLHPEKLSKALYKLQNPHKQKQDHWNHYTSSERALFLQEAQKKPDLLVKHHRWVLTGCLWYLVLFTLSSLFLVTLHFETPLSQLTTHWIQQAQEVCSQKINTHLREQVDNYLFASL